MSRVFLVLFQPRSATPRCWLRLACYLCPSVVALSILWPQRAAASEPDEMQPEPADVQEASEPAGPPKADNGAAKTERTEAGDGEGDEGAAEPVPAARANDGEGEGHAAKDEERVVVRAEPVTAAPATDGEGEGHAAKDEERIVVRGYRVLATDRTTGFAETIEVAQEAKTLSSVSDVLGEAAGVQVRQLGGLGSYGAASIRGSTPNQVPVYLDGVLLNAGGFSAVDLGQLSLDTLDTVEIYRGGAPLSLGASGIGGAIRLTTRKFDGPVSETALSYGSWSTARVLALGGDRIGDVNSLTLFSVQGAEGDYPYLNSEVSEIQSRQNNQHLAYAALAKVDSHVGDWDWTLANHLYSKQQGLAGIAGEPTQTAALGTFRDSLWLRFAGPVTDSAVVTLETGYLAMHEDLGDEDNEIGLGERHVRSFGHAPGGGASLQVAHGEAHITRARLDSRYERFTWNESLGDFESPAQQRLRGLAGVEHEWWLAPEMAVVPALRTELLYSRFAGGQLYPEAEPWQGTSFWQAFWAPSLGWRFELLAGLVLRANAGRYVRPPAITELFGDRGMAVGNPQLRPEVGINADAGGTYVVEGLGAISTVRLDAAWFGSWVDDLIVYEQNSQSTVRPENVASAEMLGLESSLRLGFYERAFVEGNYTYLYAVNKTPLYFGNPLPARPTHEVYGKFQVKQVLGRWAAAAWCDMDYATETYVRRAALDDSWIAPRLLLGLGLRVERPLQGLSLTVEAKNLLNTITFEDSEGRATAFRDFEGFPLPGRTILATLHWSMRHPGGAT